MQDFLVAIGLVLAIEGLVFAAVPRTAKRLAASALDAPDSSSCSHESIHEAASALAAPEGMLRIAGVICAVLGVLIVWLVRG